MNYLRLEWVTSFIGCVMGHTILNKGGLSSNISNITTCMMFQLYFVYNTGLLLHDEVFYGFTSNSLSSANISTLYGYFVYDLLHLLMEDNLTRNRTYILHHITSCLIIDIVLDLEIKDTFYMNAFLVAAEATSPFINARILVKDYPTVKQINKSIIKYSYFTFRIVAFPVLAIGFLSQPNIDLYTKGLLSSAFVGIYMATVNWFSKIVS